MKKIVHKISFVCRLAFKNIVHFKLRTFLFIISFSALFIMILIGFSTKGLLTNYYYSAQEDKYGKIDVTMGINFNANTRYFSIRPLFEASELDGMIDDYIPFFEFDTRIGVPTQDQLYVKTMASSLAHFKKVSNTLIYPYDTLANHEVIITQSLSETYLLSINDDLTLYVGETHTTYTIVDVVEDGGLFQGDTIFINKDGALSFFLTALNSSLGSLDPSLLTNIYNQVYIDAAPGVSTTDLIETLKSIESFSNLELDQSIDITYLDGMIRRNTIIFDLILSLVFLAVILVMQTTFLLYFDEKRKTFSIINLLGGTDIFSYLAVLLEICIYFIISLVISIHLANIIIERGLMFMGSSSTYKIQQQTIWFGVLIASSIYILTSLYYFIKFKKRSSIEQSKDLGARQNTPLMLISITFLITLLLYILMESRVADRYLSLYTSLVQAVLSIILMLSISYLLIALLPKLSKYSKKPTTFILHLKILISKKVFYQYISVMLICFLSIFLLVFANDYMRSRISTYKQEYRIDFGLINFSSHYDDTYQDVLSIDQVETATKVGFFKNVILTDINQSISSLVSIEENHIDYYFMLDIDQQARNKLNQNEKLIILLPSELHYTENLHIGDQIMIYISPTYDQVIFEIGGFFDKQQGNIAFTNMHSIEAYKDIQYNTIFINAKDNRDILRNELINRYSKNLIYVVDFQKLALSYTDEMQRATHYILMILSVMISCFVLSIINHSHLLLRQMKDTYARLFVLGFSKAKLFNLLLIENLAIVLILLTASILGFYTLSSQLRDIIILNNEYENIYFNPQSLLFGIVIILLVYVLSRILYITGVLHLKSSDIVKTY